MTDAIAKQFDINGLRLWTGAVLPEWLDYNGHMTEHRYLQVFGESSDALYAELGVDFAAAINGAYFTLETHIRHRAEAKLGTPLWSTTQILGYDAKRLHIWHDLYDAQGQCLAHAEHLTLHMAQGKVAAASAAMQEKIHAIFTQQSAVPLPEDSGRVLRKELENRRNSVEK